MNTVSSWQPSRRRLFPKLTANRSCACIGLTTFLRLVLCLGPQTCALHWSNWKCFVESSCGDRTIWIFFLIVTEELDCMCLGTETPLFLFVWRTEISRSKVSNEPAAIRRAEKLTSWTVSRTLAWAGHFHEKAQIVRRTLRSKPRWSSGAGLLCLDRVRISHFRTSMTDQWPTCPGVLTKNTRCRLHRPLAE
jgi:hypothetical protein